MFFFSSSKFPDESASIEVLKVRNFGISKPWLMFLVGVIRVMLSDRAITQGCWIKRHFVFFSSHTLSAKTVLTEQESQGGRDRQRETGIERKTDPTTGGLTGR